MHYPLSSGKNPRFGGVQELRQIHFEHGAPWFPADFLGTHAGSTWEAEERAKRKAEWDKRPKGKRIEWESLDLGNCRKGEIGDGWACDYERVVGISPLHNVDMSIEMTQETEASTAQKPKATNKSLQHLSSKSFTKLISAPSPELPSAFTISTVCITLVTRGIASPCARIYRLPAPRGPQDSATISSAPATTREEWLALLPQTLTTKPLPNRKRQDLKNIGRIPLNTPLPQRVRLLAQSLLQTPPLPYPADKVENDGFPLVPDEEDLIGFVTTGEFNLAEGKGVAIGNVVVRKVLEGLRGGTKGDKRDRFCIVRNAGEKIGRLARWEVV